MCGSEYLLHKLLLLKVDATKWGGKKKKPVSFELLRKNGAGRLSILGRMGYYMGVGDANRLPLPTKKNVRRRLLRRLNATRLIPGSGQGISI
jgi:hypothetical protein